MSPFFLVLGTRYLHLNLKSEVGGPAKAMGFCGYGSGFEPRHSLQKRTSKWMSFFVLSNFDYWFFYSFSRLGLPARWGRYPLGVSFERAKETKTRLGRSPLRTSLGVRGWNCVKSKFGPLPLLWPLLLPPYQATLDSWPYRWVVSTSGPTLGMRRSRRREPGFRQLGTVAHQGKALGVEGIIFREAGIFGRIICPSM